MNEQDFLYLARLAGIEPGRVRKVHELFESGATVPFIARYRKEITGGLDEVVLIKLRDGIDALQKLHKRRENILESLRERELLTPELEKEKWVRRPFVPKENKEAAQQHTALPNQLTAT